MSVNVHFASYTLCGLLAVFVLSKILQYGHRPATFPPGPPTIPVLGNLHQMPIKNFHLETQKLAKKYGSIVSMKLGGQNLFLLNDPAVVRDLLEKRSANYSCRPDLYIRHFGNNLNIAFRDNDDIWRRQRKMYHVRLNVTSADRYLPYQHFDSVQLLRDLALRPEAWVQHVQRYTASISTALLYGWRTPDTNAGYIQDLLEWMDVTSEAANFQVVDFYPFLRPLYDMLPIWMVSSKKKLSELQKLEDRVFHQLLDRAKANLASGTANPSFIRDLLLDKDSDRLDDNQIAHNVAHGFGAAMQVIERIAPHQTLTDSQGHIGKHNLGFCEVLTRQLAMVLFPEIQAKAQEELDSVIGISRLPEWADRKDLPYCRGVVEETLRWAPSPLSAAVPHSAKQDDVYNGMTIPKGSMVMMNVWTLNHERYDDSRKFDPMRHSAETTLPESHAINQDSPKRRHFTFGAGRRVCPGFHVAERNLFIAISRILWSFNIQPAKDSHGQAVPINRDGVTLGLIVRPEDFDCNIRPRSVKHEQLISTLWKESEDKLDSEGNFTAEYLETVFGGGK